MECWGPLPERFPGGADWASASAPVPVRVSLRQRPQSSAEKPRRAAETVGLTAVGRGLLGNSSSGYLYWELEVEESK